MWDTVLQAPFNTRLLSTIASRTMLKYEHTRRTRRRLSLSRWDLLRCITSVKRSVLVATQQR